MLRGLKLVGDIEAVELKEGTLTVTIDGEEMVYAVGGAPTTEAVDRPRRGRRPREEAQAEETQTAPATPTPPSPQRPNGSAGPAQVGPSPVRAEVAASK